MMHLENTSANDTTPAPEETKKTTSPCHATHDCHPPPLHQQQQQSDDDEDDEDGDGDDLQPDQDTSRHSSHSGQDTKTSSRAQDDKTPPSPPASASRPTTPPPQSIADDANNTTVTSAATVNTTAKKRKLAELQSGSRSRSASRPPSPPWKKFGAEGPTAFIDNGKRRSGRVNAVPLELQPPSGKRQTRSKHVQSTPMKDERKPIKDERKSAKDEKKITKSVKQPAETNPPIAPVSSPPRKSSSHLRKPSQEKPKQNTKPQSTDQDNPATSSPRKTPSTKLKPIKPELDTPAHSSPRIKLKLRRTDSAFIPRHPSHIPSVPQFATLQESLAAIDAKEKEFERTARIDENYQGLERARPANDRDRAPESTPEELAEKEARIRLRILEAARPGGVLSQEKCSLYLPDEQPQPRVQYTINDHIWAHGAYFRLLLDREKRLHMEQAKKVAYAAMARWKEKQPQTEEEKEREERAFFEIVYRQLVKDMGRKWELVGEEINRRRHARWEVEEKKRREKRMQEVMERSTNLLDARKAAREAREESLLSADSMDGGDYKDGDSSASATDDDDDDGDEEKEDSDVMSDDSGTDTEEDGTADDPDVNLSPEALRRKYSSLPELPQEDDAEDEEEENEEEEEANEEEEGENMAEKEVKEEEEGDDERGANEMDIDKDDSAHQINNADRDHPAEHDRDYSNIQLEEVDDALLDDTDESVDMSDEDMTSEEDEEDEEENEGSDEEEDDDDDDNVGLLSLFKKDLAQNMAGDVAAPTQQPDATASDPPATVAVDETKDKQLILPTTDQIKATESASLKDTADGDSACETGDATAEQGNVERHDSEMSHDHNLLSVDSHGEDRSSQLSVKYDTTAEPTDAESTTSIELENGEKAAHSTESTPQPGQAPRTKVPSLLRGTLREYQHEGLDWLAKLYANQTNGILADEMGLGKTIQTIALLAHLAEEHEIWGPHLIVVPTSVILNWEMEFKKFLPGFKVLSYYGTVEERSQKRKGWSNPDNYNVVITSYQLVLKDINAIKVPDWHYMILDEAHNIKNFNSQRYRAMIRLKTHARLLLTGTPLQNNIQELWSLLTFLTAGHDGQGMGELHEFEEWFSKPVNEIFMDSRQTLSGEAQKIVNKLHHSLRPYLLRRLKVHVEKQLPGKYEHTVICRLSKRQRQLYDAFMGLSDTKAKLLSGNMVSVSMALMALRKVCNHPDLFEERPIVTSFAMPKPYSNRPRAAIADYEIKDLLIRKQLLAKEPTSEVNLNFLSLNLASREGQSGYHVRRSRQLRSTAILEEIARREYLSLSKDATFNGSSIRSTLAYQNRQTTANRLDKIRRYAFLTKQRTDFAPIYGTDLVERLTIRSATDRLARLPPRERMSHMDWYMSTSNLLQSIAKTLPERSDEMQPYVAKFGCITPNVVADDLLSYTTPAATINAIRTAAQSDLISEVKKTSSPASDLKVDPFHESRIRLSIAFPDRRLLQYDCGKLQRLALLLRSLQSKGSRALIFTQMTSVLDILESFLNIHGYRYLRLDGSTRIEQRQDMMERFNRDTRIDVFILSSRSGGVGMNLTGADTVIFYDLDWNPQMDRQCQDRAHRIGQMRDVHIYKFVSESTIEVNILKRSNQKRLLDEVVIQEGEFTTDWFNRPDPDQEQQKLVEVATAEDDVAGAAVDKFFGQAGGASNVGGQQQIHDITKVLESVEDAEDVAAARGQQRELQEVAMDFELDERAGAGGVGSRGSRSGTNPGTPRASMPPTPFDSTFTPLGQQSVTDDVESLRIGHGGEDVVESEAEKDEVVVKADGREEEVKHVDEYMLRFFEEFALKDVAYVPPVDKKRARLDRNGRDRGHRAKRIR